MTIGFVYLIVNYHMPRVFKLGCTERAPSLRAEELSRSTSVPIDFEVVCYIEVDDHKEEERRMHELFSSRRVRTEREFFRWGNTYDERAAVIGAFVHNENLRAFAWADESALADHIPIDQLPRDLHDLGSWPNPWTEESAETRIGTKKNGGDDESL